MGYISTARMKYLLLLLLAVASAAKEIGEMKAEIITGLDTISSIVEGDETADPDLKSRISARVAKVRQHVNEDENSSVDQLANSFLEFKRSMNIYSTELIGLQLAAKYPEFGQSAFPGDLDALPAIPHPHYGPLDGQ